MNSERFDEWLDMNGAVAIVIREDLEPVQGNDSVFFPPTFAPPEGSKEAPSYVIDETGDAKTSLKVALVDTVGSQANRMEPLFKQAPYSELVPKAIVKIGSREIDLLDAGHRAADAIVRFSDKWQELREAFLSIREKRDATKLAKLSPTSLVFGVWDSRDTQVKLPRIVGATIRAYDVAKLTRSAQYFTAIEKSETEGLAPQEYLSAVGLDHAPAGRTDGGVLSRGGIRREAVLNLVALRAVTAGDAESTRKLQRYVLGLALVALLARAQRFLRVGCLLVPTGGEDSQTKVVNRSGHREALAITENDAMQFAKAVADDFGVGGAWTANFDGESVKKSSEKKEQDKAKKTKKAK